MPQHREITPLQINWNSGNEAALDNFMLLVEGELRRIAAHYKC